MRNSYSQRQNGSRKKGVSCAGLLGKVRYILNLSIQLGTFFLCFQFGSVLCESAQVEAMGVRVDEVANASLLVQ